MPYLTEAEFVDLYSSTEAIQLTNIYTPSATTVDTDRLDAAIQYAENLINGYLSKRLTLPLTVVPLVIKNLTGDIARYHLDLLRGRDDVKYRYEKAMEWLQDYVMGKTCLGLEDDGAGGEQETEETRSRGRYSNVCPRFTKENLSAPFYPPGYRG